MKGYFWGIIFIAVGMFVGGFYFCRASGKESKTICEKMEPADSFLDSFANGAKAYMACERRLQIY